MPEPEQPAAPDQLTQLEPLEAHIVALRAQLAHHERMLALCTGGLLAAAIALLVASRAKVRP